ncbi:MAG: hypothetical protein V2I97_12235 [Desulfococcaceae bacterium]|jgi:hypothetical protein|nr:hypothetical protein [Desulfococcaceae bacterium]
MKKKGKSAVILLIGVMCMAGTVWGEENSLADITKEVLTGPNEMNPKKILGPGGIGIETNKDLLMSFGATVRFVPTQESNWDFGMHKDVPGYFNTTGLKDFAGGMVNAADSVQGIYQSSLTLNDAIANSRGNDAVISAYDNFSTSFYTANEATKISPALNANVSALAGSMQLIDTNVSSAVNGIAVPVTTPIADAAAAAAVEAAFTPGANIGSITGAALTAANAAATATAAGFSDPQQKVIATVSGSAAASSAAPAAATTAAGAAQMAFQQAAQAGMDLTDPNVLAAVKAAAADAAKSAATLSAANAASNAASDAAKAAVISTAVSTPNDALGGATLIQVSDSLAAGLAKSVNSDPNATAADLTGSQAYLSVLKARADSFKPYYLASTFLRVHSNESGAVDDGYIRNETKMYFNAMPKDKKWSFYAALEFDRAIDTDTVDNRGGRGDEGSDFGMERLNASIELVEGLRLHGGWDVWGLDVIEAASMVYGDDNAGFWLKGDYDPIAFSLAWHKLKENDFQTRGDELDSATDSDRDLIAGYVDYFFRETDKFRFFYGWDRIRDVPSYDFTGYLSAQAGVEAYGGIYGNNGIPGAAAASPDTDTHTIGGYYLGNFNNMIEVMFEGAYKFGSADDTGLQGVHNGISTIQYNDFDISAFALAADIAFELKDLAGWESLKPHIGFMYTSGDDDPDDDTLSGFTGITSAQRFSTMWGGENTIIGDSSMVLGTAIYGYIPELYGNGTPVFTGGVQNFAGIGSGRGDNPGLTMLSAGITIRPKIFLIYRTNLNAFWWNEDFYVADMVNPVIFDQNDGALKKGNYTRVESGYVGCEWDNEILLALSKNMFLKGQFSFFFPGSGVEDVTRALSGGTESDDTAMRLASELIWNF